MTQTIYHSKVLEKLKVLKSLKEQHDKTGGHCGLYITDFKGSIQELKKEINELYKANKITIHDGIHGKLIKIKS